MYKCKQKVRGGGVFIFKEKEALRNLKIVCIYTKNAFVKADHVYVSIPLARKEYLFFFPARNTFVSGIEKKLGHMICLLIAIF